MAMSDPKPKSTIRQILESGPTDPRIMQKLELLEQLQAAHAENDQAKLLEIGQKLAANSQAIAQSQKTRRAAMRKTIAQAKKVADPEERTQKLLAAFAFCVKETCAAHADSGDRKTYNFGVKRLAEIGGELRALNRFAALEPFLDSTDIQLRGFAAVWLRNLWPERILPILQEIEKTMSFGTPAGTQVYIAMRELEQVKEKAAASQKGSEAKT
jgi:hypothetical protein